MISPDEAANWFDLALMAGAMTEGTVPGTFRITKGGFKVAAAVLGCALSCMPITGLSLAMRETMLALQATALTYDEIAAKADE